MKLKQYCECPSMHEVALFRHGQTDANINGETWQGWTNTWHLNKKGLTQAVKMREEFAEFGAAVWITSPLKRSLDTLLLASGLYDFETDDGSGFNYRLKSKGGKYLDTNSIYIDIGSGISSLNVPDYEIQNIRQGLFFLKLPEIPRYVTILIDDRWKERNYGALEGVNKADYETKHDKFAIQRMKYSFDEGDGPPKGESYSMLARRVISAMLEYAFGHDANPKSCLPLPREPGKMIIATHNNPMKVALGFGNYYERLYRNQWGEIKIKNAKIEILKRRLPLPLGQKPSQYLEGFKSKEPLSTSALIDKQLNHLPAAVHNPW